MLCFRYRSEDDTFYISILEENVGKNKDEGTLGWDVTYLGGDRRNNIIFVLQETLSLCKVLL
jgi:hypothetical protein